MRRWLLNSAASSVRRGWPVADHLQGIPLDPQGVEAAVEAYRRVPVHIAEWYESGTVLPTKLVSAAIRAYLAAQRPAADDGCRWVRVVCELLPKWAEWSEPVQFMIESEKDGELVLLLRQIPAPAPTREEEDDKRDAARWRALMACQVRFLGGAHLGFPGGVEGDSLPDDGRTLIGVEFWSPGYPQRLPDPGAAYLRAFADHVAALVPQEGA